MKVQINRPIPSWNFQGAASVKPATVVHASLYETQPICFGSRAEIIMNPTSASGATRLSSGELRDIEKLLDDPEKKELGHGSYAKAYLIPNSELGRAMVLKVPHSAGAALADGRIPLLEDNIAKEAAIVSKLPPLTHDGQGMQLLGFLQYKGKKVLVLSFVEGESLKSYKGPLNSDQLSSLINYFAQLDYRKIYHSDMTPNNILLKPRQANLIDYGDAFDVEPLALQRRFDPIHNIFSPEFSFLDNGTHFQTKNLMFHFHKLLGADSEGGPKQIVGLFKEFLKLKSQAQKEYAAYIQQNLSGYSIPERTQEALRYTTLQAKFLENPSKDLLVQQAWKTEALFCNALSGAQAEFFGNHRTAYSWAQKAVEATQQYQAATAQLADKHKSNKDCQKFMDYEKAYGEFLAEGTSVQLAKATSEYGKGEHQSPPLSPQLRIANTMQEYLAQA